VPMQTVLAVLTIPIPVARSRLISVILAADTCGRPIGLPERVLRVLAAATPNLKELLRIEQFNPFNPSLISYRFLC
jgi:hypothetical protein